ncbi:MAG: transglutaminase-like domain-containing protein [Planctomycetota bacterium]
MKPYHLITPLLYAALALNIFPAQAAQVLEDRWYVVFNGEDRIGYMHTTVNQEGDAGPITTTQDVKFVMSRGGTVIELAVGSLFVETPEGRPVRASSTLNMGGLPIETEVAFLDQGVRVSSGQAGRMTTQMQPPIAGDWLPPQALSRYVEAQLAAGAEVIEASTVDVSAGLKPITTRMVRVGPQAIEVYGKTVPATAWDVTASNLPSVTLRDYLDDEGTSIKSTIPLLPGLELTVLEADKALALSKLTPAEMMAQTFVTPSRKIDRPRELKRAVYRLRTRDGRAMPELPTSSVQRLVGEQLIVDLSGEPLGEAAGEAHLAASAVLNHEDPAVQRWLEEFRFLSFDGPADSADWLRRKVHQDIEAKDLSVGFATASDVARTKQGDCTEHAVLLAALLRGAGIPSRCVSGLIYADQFAGHEGIFGYHMWTQAWIDDDGDGPSPGRWIDFDATLPDGVRFDATHIALLVSDMSDGAVTNDMAALLPVLGNLEIEVVETGYHVPVGAE